MDHFTRSGLTFDVIDSGPVDGTPVVLLHGFPQDAHAYDEVRPLLNDRGLRTLAPHQRGYSRGARPDDPAAYVMRELVADVLALLDQAGLEQAHLVGHDWGAAVAWAVAIRHPGRVASLTALSVPHPDAMGWALRHSAQGLKSWYMLAVQVPRLPEQLVLGPLGGGFEQGLTRLGVPPEPARHYAARFRRPEDLRGPLNWYRALRHQTSRSTAKTGASGSSGTKTERGTSVTVPTTFVWGNQDAYLGRAGAERTGEHVSADYRFVEVDATHWLPETQPELVAAEIAARALGETAPPEPLTLTERFGNQPFLSVTTFRRSGAPVSTPMWVVQDGDHLAFTTPLGAGKLKRLKHTQRVEVTPCDRRGRVADGAERMPGTAVVSTGSRELARVERLLEQKYRFEYHVMKVVERVASRGERDRAVLRVDVDRP